MNVWSRRLAMSFIVSLGLALSRSSAQAPLIPASQPIDPAPVTPLAVVLQREASPPARFPFRAANKCGYLCGGDNEWSGCGNWATEFRFVFGSCRQFFAEPCAPMPPVLYNDYQKNFLPPPPPQPPETAGRGVRGFFGGNGPSGGCPSCLLN